MWFGNDAHHREWSSRPQGNVYGPPARQRERTDGECILRWDECVSSFVTDGCDIRVEISRDIIASHWNKRKRLKSVNEKYNFISVNDSIAIELGMGLLRIDGDEDTPSTLLRFYISSDWRTEEQMAIIEGYSSYRHNGWCFLHYGNPSFVRAYSIDDDAEPVEFTIEEFGHGYFYYMHSKRDDLKRFIECCEACWEEEEEEEEF